MGSGNSRNLTIDRDDYSEKSPPFMKKSYNPDDLQHSYDSASYQSFEPAKTDFVRNLESTQGELISEAELNELKEMYGQKIDNLQKENAQLNGATVDNLSRTVQRVEDKFIKASNKTICEDIQAEMIVCLKRNKGEVLNCVKSVEQFNLCMQQYRGKEGMYVIHNNLGAKLH